MGRSKDREGNCLFTGGTLLLIDLSYTMFGIKTEMNQANCHSKELPGLVSRWVAQF